MVNEKDSDDDLADFEFTGADGSNYLIHDGEWTNTDRKRGILTKGDREYLLNQDSLEGQDRRNARYRIRQRLSNALLDLALLTEVQMGEDLKQVVEKEDIDDEFITEAAVVFAYDLIRYNSRFENPIDIFEIMIEEALEKRVDESSPDTGQILISQLRSEANLEVEEELIGKTVENNDGELTIRLDPSSSERFDEVADSMIEQIKGVSDKEYRELDEE